MRPCCDVLRRPGQPERAPSARVHAAFAPGHRPDDWLSLTCAHARPRAAQRSRIRASRSTQRHELNDFLLDAGGHIGYGIRPSRRRQGLASWALAAVLDEARALGLTRVLVTCDADSVASARTIERNGGRLEDVREITPARCSLRSHRAGDPERSLGLTRRYWIEL